MQSYDTYMLMLKGEYPKRLHLVTFPLFSFELTFFSIHFQWPLIRNHLVIFFLKCFLKIRCSVGVCGRLVPQVADCETEICVQKIYWALLLRIDLVWDERKGDALKKKKKAGVWKGCSVKHKVFNWSQEELLSWDAPSEFSLIGPRE